MTTLNPRLDPKPYIPLEPFKGTLKGTLITPLITHEPPSAQTAKANPKPTPRNTGAAGLGFKGGLGQRVQGFRD